MVPEDACEYQARKEALAQSMVYKPYSSLMPVVRPGQESLADEDVKWAWLRK